MSRTVLKVENLYKQYRLGLVGSGTLKDDLARWWAKMRGKEDPLLKIGESNKLDTIDGDYVWALKNINFEVKQGEVLGIIGKNGAGKSTLLKILSKVTGPSKGSIKVKGRVASLLEVGTGFHPELTGRENIFLNGAILGMNKREIRSKLDEIIDFAGVSKYVDTPVKRYSSGMYVRLAFAVAAHLDPEVLIVDEVLAVGDIDFQEKAIGKMKDVSKGEGRTVLFVSHNMKSVKSLCTRGILLRNGQVQDTGDIHSVVQTYLNKNKGLVFDGTISDDVFRSGTGEVLFKEVRLLSDNHKVTDTVFYKEKIRLSLTIEALIDVPALLVGFQIVSANGEKIGMALSKDETKDTTLRVNKGRHKILVEVENNLLPGKYAFNLSMSMFPSGNDVDIIDNICDFRVLEFTQHKNGHFKWTTHGYVLLNATFTLQSS
ncbi:ABC transporter ATP-binding protein [uncultured Microscilla sp.]|uniref:ABC transporter ATP-binding protein n=1 Tax=uncultured Microscilla sp. TaxID=432653 RepID=UPI002609F4BA|nr:ABC transporter ATP-binding protein [uncultured Microscilla sp.]